MNVKNSCLLFLLLVCAPLHAIVVGSDTVPSEQPFIVFPAFDTDNEMRGFACFDSGFRLENSSASCRYNSFYPISGPVVLNGGTLHLNEDLQYQTPVNIKTLGSINGNSYALQFTTTDDFLLPSGDAGGQVLTFVAQYNMANAVNSVGWAYDGLSVAAAANTALRVFSFNGTTLTSRANTTLSTAINSLAWRPGSTFLATGIQNSGTASELQVWYYNPVAYTLTAKGSANLNRNVVAVAWTPNGNHIAQADSTPRVRIYSFNVTTSLITLVTTYNTTQAISPRALSWDSTGAYLAVGMASTTGSELRVLYFNGTTLTLNASAELGQIVRAVSYSPTASLIAVGLSGGTQRFQLYAHNPTAGTLTQILTATLNETLTVNALDWDASGTQLLLARAPGTGPTELRTYEFDPINFLFYLISQNDFTGTINSAAWRNDGTYIALGSTSNFLDIYDNDRQLLTNGLIFGNVKMTINSDVLLQNTLTFTGNCSVDGCGYDLSLGTSGNIVVGSGSSVLLKNVTINNVAGTNIRCLDAASTLSLCDCTLDLDGDWTFTQGKFAFTGETKFTGTQIFTYRTTSTTTLFDNATWYFDSGMTFSYAPSNGATSLIAFNSSFSWLYLYQATLCTPTTGLKLTKGTVVLDGPCPLVNAATSSSGGLILGDGALATNNITITVLPGSGFVCGSGFLVNNNV